MDSVLKQNKYKEIVFSSKGLVSKNPESVLFYKGSRSRNFFTNDSGLYFDSSDEFARKNANKDKNKFFDSLNYQEKEIVSRYRKIRGKNSDILYIKYQILRRKLERNKVKINSKSRFLFEDLSLVRLWNTSMVAAVLVGMVSMTAIYKYLGQGASAVDVSYKIASQQEIGEKEEVEVWSKEKEAAYIEEVSSYLKAEEDSKFRKKAREMVKGYPIENMIEEILRKDRNVASFLIAIAKKESNWGKRVPVLNGKDCLNYWGYRGIRKRMGTGGHTCFADNRDAVDTVGDRIEELINKYDRDTPKKMVVWKCGSNCDVTGGQAAADKWIRDVDIYIDKLNKL